VGSLIGGGFIYYLDRRLQEKTDAVRRRLAALAIRARQEVLNHFVMMCRDDNETGLFESECKRRRAQHIHDWVFDNRVTHYGSNSPSPLASPEDTVVSFHALARFALRALACSC
jgi:hypothetical protein